MNQPAIGILQALDLITGSFALAEHRLAEKMRPARLSPLNLSSQNGRAASDAVIYGIRRAKEAPAQSACA
jgi:hypothetical protein